MLDPPDCTALHPRLKIDAETTTVYLSTRSGDEYRHDMTVDNWETLKTEQQPTYYCEICDVIGDEECKNPFNHHYECPVCEEEMDSIVYIFTHRHRETQRDDEEASSF
jgi:hypothetical protein